MNFLFTFFLSLCIAQPSCLAGKHTPSEAEQGSENQTHSKLRTANPTNDLRLHPAKGETVWVRETEHICRHPYFGGKVFEFTYTEIAEITLAHPAWNPDMLTIAIELEKHDKSITRPLKERNMKASFSPKGQETNFSILGSSEQYSLFLKFAPKMARAQPIIYKQLLCSMLMSAKKEGMVKVWTELKQDADLTDEQLLTSVGFAKDCSFPNLNNGHQTRQFSLKLADFDEPDQDLSSQIQVSWKDEEVSDFYPIFGSCFAFFLRDEQGNIQGGSFGALHLNTTTSYCEIAAIWVDHDLRGRGYGSLLLEMAENYAHSAGALVVQLATADYQAPGLYSKKGYVCFRTLENLTQLPDGTYASSYGFRKKF